MNYVFVVLWMIFFHIVDDYYLQGWLASAKQKEWWQRNAPQNMYKYDYTWALLMHSFSWAFMIMLPIAYWNLFDVDAFFVFILGINMAIHGITDDLKANARVINLWVDQLIHMFQIAATTFIFYVV